MPVVMMSSTAAYDRRLAALSCLSSCLVPNSSALNIQPRMCRASGTGDRMVPLCNGNTLTCSLRVTSSLALKKGNVGIAVLRKDKGKYRGKCGGRICQQHHSLYS